MSRGFCCISVLALLPGIALAAAGPPPQVPLPMALSADDAVALAIGQADPIKLARLDLAATEGQIMGARATALPVLSFESSFTRQSYGHIFGGSSLSSVFSGAGAPSAAATTDFYRADLVLRQPLYQGGRARASLRAASLGREMALAQLESVSESVVFATKSAYYRLLIERELVKVAQVSLALAEKHLKDATDQRAAGAATDFEVLRAKVRRRSTQAELIRARNSFRLAEALLARGLGLDPKTRIQPTDELRYVPVSVREHDLYSRAMAGRGDFKVAAVNVQGNEVLVRLAQAERLPQVHLSASVGGGAERHFTRASNFEDDWTLGLQVSVPLFDGMSARGKILEQTARLDQARAQLEALGRDIRLGVHQAVLALESAREMVATQKESVAEATRAYELAETRFQAGQVKQLVVFDAEAELANAKRTYFQAVYEHMIAAADLERTAGFFQLPHPKTSAATDPAGEPTQEPGVAP